MALEWAENSPEAGGWHTRDGNYDLVPDDDRNRWVMRCNAGGADFPDWETVSEFVTPADAFAYEPLRYRCDMHGLDNLLAPCSLRHRDVVPTRAVSRNTRDGGF
jgi:hypothetical protein